MDIIGAKVVLKESNEALWHEFYKNYVNDFILGGDVNVYNHETVQNNFNKKAGDKTRLYFFILNDNSVIGQIYLKQIDWEKKVAAFGVALINDSVKGLGYGTEAIKLLINHAFIVLGLKRILADTLLGNLRSQHVLENLGFVFKSQNLNFLYYELENHGKKYSEV